MTTASSLQIQLNSIKMRNGEDVNDYCHRVEKLYYKLCTACTLNKEESEARLIHETLKEQTLNIFIKGLITPIRTIVKARNPKTLEVAKRLAKAEEVEYNTERENSRYRNDFSNNKDLELVLKNLNPLLISLF
ncbi:uncharacterized protein LOC112599562 [Melanaphis sacchari]|uniref:uncharacterized protein LOC112599562 n=1 Tax=Melanaphis sacchari TaxID=742174 RepID=UPI000DC15136|nr:uncharacterized protein LOC112599562 [Melanaphis sacchari]